MSSDEEVQQLLRKYKRRLESQLNTTAEPKPIESREYQQFKLENMPRALTIYEKLCALSEKTLKVKPDANRAKILEESI